MSTEYKDYLIVTEVGGTLKRIRQKGSGPVSEKLQGLFTTNKFAEQAIDSYLETNKKGKDNAKAVSAP